MTDKQIIIDGVDVSGCKYYVENNGIEAQGCYELTDLCECNNENEFCDNNSNCYYKQLKRKEQECEELKEQLERADEDIKMKCTRCAMTNLLDEQLDQLKTENEELKNRVAELSLFQLYKIQRDEAEETLIEIKEIATCCIEGDVARIRMKQILNKISEVIENE